MFLNTAVWIRLLLAIIVAFVISFAITPVVKAFATKVGAVDVPGEARRIHDHPIPRMGGLAIFFGFLLSVLLFVDVTREVRGILLGAIIIVATGAIDDIVSLRAWTKFLIQILAAVIAVLHGVVIHVVMNPNVFSEQEAIVLGWLAVPITVLWIVGITNSVNLIDGLDGLAVGVSTISCITILVVALLVSEPNVALIVSGRKHKYKVKEADGKETIKSFGYRIVRGGATFVIPFFERVDKLNLGIMQVDIKTTQPVPTQEYIGMMAWQTSRSARTMCPWPPRRSSSWAGSSRRSPPSPCRCWKATCARSSAA